MKDRPTRKEESSKISFML